MSGDVGFVPGSLIEAASGVQDACDPFVESVSSLGDEVAGLIPGVNGSYVEPLSSSLELWGESLKVLFDDLGRLVEALVGVENSFGACESEIVGFARSGCLWLWRGWRGFVGGKSIRFGVGWCRFFCWQGCFWCLVGVGAV